MKDFQNRHIKKRSRGDIVYRLVDLFAGAGGMSNGFLQTGKFTIIAAVEKDEMAQKTYMKNHTVLVMESDINDLDFKEMKERFGEIDVIIGGPPCQGFSNTNRQKNQLISTNNQLVKKYVEAVTNLKPKAFVMENVGMLRSEVHRFFVTHSEKNIIKNENIQLREEVIKIGQNKTLANYINNHELSLNHWNSLSFNKYQLNLIKDLYKKSVDKIEYRLYLKKHPVKTKKHLLQLIEKFQENSIPIAESIREDLVYIINSYEDNFINIELVHTKLKELIHIQKAVTSIIDLFTNDVDFQISVDKDQMFAIVNTYSVVNYLTSALGEMYHLTKGILNSSNFGVPQYRERFIMLGILKKLAKEEEVELPKPIITEGEYITVYDAIADLEAEPTTFQANEKGRLRKNPITIKTKYQNYVCNCPTIHNHIVTNTKDVALRRFASLKPGQNFHDLSNELKHETYSDVTRTQNTIYKRLDYNVVSGTVLNIRKSMWIHPAINRAVSIREAARLQSFQDSFIFYGSKDGQYQQIGNAVPPLLARGIAEKLLQLLGDAPEQYLSHIL